MPTPVTPQWRMPTFLNPPPTTPQVPQSLLRPTFMNGVRKMRGRGLGVHTWRKTAGPRVGFGSLVGSPLGAITFGQTDADGSAVFSVAGARVPVASVAVGGGAVGVLMGMQAKQPLIGSAIGLIVGMTAPYIAHSFME